MPAGEGRGGERDGGDDRLASLRRTPACGPSKPCPMTDPARTTSPISKRPWRASSTASGSRPRPIGPTRSAGPPSPGGGALLRPVPGLRAGPDRPGGCSCTSRSARARCRRATLAKVLPHHSALSPPPCERSWRASTTSSIHVVSQVVGIRCDSGIAAARERGRSDRLVPALRSPATDRSGLVAAGLQERQRRSGRETPNGSHDAMGSGARSKLPASPHDAR